MPSRPMKIHGKWYDVAQFEHPGGPVMLELGYKRDATAMFEAHHPFTPRPKLEQLLRKYEISGKRVRVCVLLSVL